MSIQTVNNFLGQIWECHFYVANDIPYFFANTLETAHFIRLDCFNVYYKKVRAVNDTKQNYIVKLVHSNNSSEISFVATSMKLQHFSSDSLEKSNGWHRLNLDHSKVEEAPPVVRI